MYAGGRKIYKKKAWRKLRRNKSLIIILIIMIMSELLYAVKTEKIVLSELWKVKSSTERYLRKWEINWSQEEGEFTIYKTEERLIH